VKNTTVRKQSWQLIATMAALLILKKLISNSSGYEDDLYAQLHQTWHIITHLTDIYSFKFFTGEFKLQGAFFRIYWMPTALFLLSLWLIIAKKDWKVLAYQLLSSIGLWLLIIILFNRGDGTIFMEKNFTPWIFVALYPLAFYINISDVKLPWATLASVVLIYVVALAGIFNVSNMYSKRLYLMDQLITQKAAGHSKLLIQDSTVNHDEWLGIWALPYETLLLSKVKSIPNVSARIYKNDASINKELYRTDIFLGADFIPVLPANYLLNQKVFPLKEETYYIIEKP